MRNIALLEEQSSERPSYTSHQRLLHRQGLECLRKYRLDRIANSQFPTARRAEESEVA